MYMIEIYDVVTKTSLVIPSRKITATCKKLGFDYSCIGKLSRGDIQYIQARYILPANKDKIFVFVNFSTNKEYDCISNGTMSYYLNPPPTRQEGKSLSNLIKGKQKLASIGGKIFMLKGTKKTNRFHFVKAADEKYNKLKLERQLARRIGDKLSKRVRKFVSNKTSKTQELVGCNYDFLMGYLEKQFTNGMTWENYGKDGWHIDHIQPCASFDLSNPDEQKVCFHYSNLQPLWATSSIAKQHGEENYIGNVEKSNQKILGGRQT